MTTENFFIISAEFTIKDEYRADLVKLVLELTPLSQSESDCISYSFFEDLMQSGCFLFFERWKSREAINQHFEKPYFKKFTEAIQIMTEKASIEIHEVASTETL